MPFWHDFSKYCRIYQAKKGYQTTTNVVIGRDFCVDWMLKPLKKTYRWWNRGRNLGIAQNGWMSSYCIRLYQTISIIKKIVNAKLSQNSRHIPVFFLWQTAKICWQNLSQIRQQRSHPKSWSFSRWNKHHQRGMASWNLRSRMWKITATAAWRVMSFVFFFLGALWDRKFTRVFFPQVMGEYGWIWVNSQMGNPQVTMGLTTKLL